MSSKYTNSIGTKLDWRQKQLWDYLCNHRGIKSAEYLRRLVLDVIDEYTKRPDFKKYVKQRDAEGPRNEH